MKLDIKADSVRTAMVAQAVEAGTAEQIANAIVATERWLADHPNDWVIERLQAQLRSQLDRSKTVDLRFL